MLDIIEIGIIFIFTITIVIVVSHIIYTKYYTIYPEVNWYYGNNENNSGKQYNLAKDALILEINNRGMPTSLDRSFQGIAKWSSIDLRKQGMPYSAIIIRDKSQLISNPYMHIPFLEYYIPITNFNKFNVNINKLISLTTLLHYDPTTKELVARSDSATVNQYVLSLASRYLHEKLTMDELKTEILNLETNISIIKNNTAIGFSYERELYF